jgi:hypothetical protein
MIAHADRHVLAAPGHQLLDAGLARAIHDLAPTTRNSPKQPPSPSTRSAAPLTTGPAPAQSDPELDAQVRPAQEPRPPRMLVELARDELRVAGDSPRTSRRLQALR